MTAPCGARSRTVLVTPRLRFREADAGDLPALEAMFADRDVMAHYLEATGPEAAANWLRALRRFSLRLGFAPWTVELHDGTFAGQCGPFPQLVDGRPEVEIVCFLLRRFWRDGYSDEACLASLTFAFERLAIERAVALILAANRPSKRLALRCGMRFARRLEHDGIAMELFALERAAFQASTRCWMRPETSSISRSASSPLAASA